MDKRGLGAAWHGGWSFKSTYSSEDGLEIIYQATSPKRYTALPKVAHVAHVAEIAYICTAYCFQNEAAGVILEEAREEIIWRMEIWQLE
jgi:hypothetical protein